MGFAWIKSLGGIFSGAADNRTPFERDRDGLFDAARRNDAGTIREIAGKYPDEFAGWKTEEGSALNVAQRNGKLEAFKALAECGSDINEDYQNGVTPLIAAIYNDQREFFDFLLEKNVGINPIGTLEVKERETGTYHYTFSALHLSVKKDDKELVVKLLERGANPSVKAAPGGYTGVSSIEYAEEKKRFLLRDLLKRAGKIRADYLARTAPPQSSEAVAPVATEGKITLLNPLQIKRPASAAV